MVDVPDIVSELLLPAYRIASVDLCPTGDSGPQFVAARLFGRIEGQVFEQQRSRTDQAHITDEHVDELRQLIHTRSSQKPAETRDALRIRKREAGRVGATAHGAKFQQCEWLA